MYNSVISEIFKLTYFYNNNRMGGSLSTQRIVSNVTEFVTGQKRKLCDVDDDDINKVIDIAMHTPKR